MSLLFEAARTSRYREYNQPMRYRGRNPDAAQCTLFMIIGVCNAMVPLPRKSRSPPATAGFTVHLPSHHINGPLLAAEAFPGCSNGHRGLRRPNQQRQLLLFVVDLPPTSTPVSLLFFVQATIRAISVYGNEALRRAFEP